MKVFIFYAFDSVPYSDEHPMRGAAITEEFLKNGHEVYFITSSFSHMHKKFRAVPKTPEKLKIVLLPAKAYTNNHSIDRIISHQRVSVSISSWLRKMESDPLPQLVIGASPPLVPNYILLQFCQKHNIPFIYDIKDLWPEEFLKFSPAKKIMKLVLKPYFNLARKLVEKSTGVISVSSDYLNYYKTSLLPKKSTVFYLGTDTQKFAKPIEVNHPISGQKKIILLGNSQAGSYLMIAARAIQNIEGMHLTIAGLKGKSDYFRERIKRERLQNIEIIPWLEKDKIDKILPGFDVGLILLNPKTKSAFPNRSFTYFAAGLPVVSSIRGGEFEKYISDHKLGLSINFVNEENIQNGIRYCIKNFDVAEHQRIQNFAKENLDRDDIYKKYYEWVIQIVDSKNVRTL